MYKNKVTGLYNNFAFPFVRFPLPSFQSPVNLMSKKCFSTYVFSLHSSRSCHTAPRPTLYLCTLQEAPDRYQTQGNNTQTWHDRHCHLPSRPNRHFQPSGISFLPIPLSSSWEEPNLREGGWGGG